MGSKIRHFYFLASISSVPAHQTIELCIFCILWRVTYLVLFDDDMYSGNILI